MAKNDQQILGVLSTSLFEQRNERVLRIQQKSFGKSSFPFYKNEKVPTNFSISALKPCFYRLKKINHSLHDVLSVIKRHKY